jgi:hypothetical protein
MASVGLTFVRCFTGEYDEVAAGHEHGEVEYAVTREDWLARG